MLTPGTAIDPALGAEQSNYLASVCVDGARGRAQFVGWLCWILSTGEFRATEFSGADGVGSGGG